MSLFTGETKALIKKLIKISSDNYPESLKKTFVINAPRYFTGVWTFVKAFLDKKTA